MLTHNLVQDRTACTEAENSGPLWDSLDRTNSTF